MQTGSSGKGTIVTFYSYKGGTGRSMMLANVAWLLATRGKRVLVIDWDLEAPGLHRYFLPFLKDKDLTSSNGVIDFIIEFALKATEKAAAEKPEKDDSWVTPYANILRYASSLKWEFGSGALDFVGAGRQSASYSTRVNSFNWLNFYDVLGGGAFLEAVKDRLRNEYDYVLIDSRTGLSDTSGICTVQMPDVVVVCFTLNNQSIDGASAVARSVFELRKGSKFRMLPVPTRTDNAELEKRQLRLEFARDAFDAVLEHIPGPERERYWGDVEIPYIPFYSYEEMLSTFRDLPSHSVSLLAPCERLTRYLTEDFESTSVALDDAKREAVLSDFANETLINYDVFISHARDDAETAEQLARRLRREKVNGRKLRVFARLWDQANDDGNINTKRNQSALNRSRRVVLLVTPEWLLSSEYDRFLDAQTSGASNGDRFIPVYYRDADIPLELRQSRFIDFRNDSDFSSAAEKLLEVLKEPAARETLSTFEAAIASQLLSPVPDIGFVSRRDRDGTILVDQLKKELTEGAVVVVWGAGGTGKTALAAEVMRSFDSSGNRRVIWFSAYEFAEAGYADVLDEILEKFDPNFEQTIDDSLKLSLLRSFASTSAALIVLDGFERISPEAQKRIEADLMSHPPCPMLVTSRQRIRSARHVMLSGFSQEELNECIDRWLTSKGGAKPNFSEDDRRRIYNLTEGIPLAVRLVLGYLNMQVSLAQALEKLDNTSGQTVERAFKLSYESLTKDRDARLVLLALSIFFPTASADALAAVTSLQKSRVKFDRSLRKLTVLGLIEESTNTNRYGLNDMVRAFCRERFADSNRTESLQKRFVDYFQQYVSERTASTETDYDELDLEEENILAAIRVAHTTNDWASVLDFGRRVALAEQWLVARGHLDEALATAQKALNAAYKLELTDDILKFASAAANVRAARREYARAADVYQEAATMLTELENPIAAARAFQQLGELHLKVGRYEEAQKYYQKSLELSSTDATISAASLAKLSEVEQSRGNNEAAFDYLQQALTVTRKLGDEQRLADYLLQSGKVAYRLDRPEDAIKLLHESLEIYSKLQINRGVATTLSWLGTISLLQENYSEAKEFYTRSLDLYRKVQDLNGTARSLYGLGKVAQEIENLDEATRLYQESLSVSEKLNDQRGIAYTLYHLGTTAHQQGNWTDARQFYTEALDILRRLNDEDLIAATLNHLGQLYENESNISEAKKAYLDASVTGTSSQAKDASENLKRLEGPGEFVA